MIISACDTEWGGIVGCEARPPHSGGASFMAQRRMFSLKIIDTDAFMEMPRDVQCLYFHLALRADDDGFVGSPRGIMRRLGAADDELKVLIAKGFVLPFESGVLVIKHWRVHNYIQKDRYEPTQYLEEKEKLESTKNGYILDTQVRLGKSKDRVITADAEKFEEDVSFETDEDYVPTRSLSRKKGIAAKGYDPAQTKELLRWAEDRMGKKFPNPKKQMASIAAMFGSGYSMENIKDTWEELERVDWLDGVDFGTVISQIGKARKKRGVIEI